MGYLLAVHVMKLYELVLKILCSNVMRKFKLEFSVARARIQMRQKRHELSSSEKEARKL